MGCHKARDFAAQAFGFRASRCGLLCWLELRVKAGWLRCELFVIFLGARVLLGGRVQGEIWLIVNHII